MVHSNLIKELESGEITRVRLTDSYPIKTIAYYSLQNDLLNIDPHIDKDFDKEISPIITDKDYSFLLEMKDVSTYPAAKIVSLYLFLISFNFTFLYSFGFSNLSCFFEQAFGIFIRLIDLPFSQVQTQRFCKE